MRLAIAAQSVQKMSGVEWVVVWDTCALMRDQWVGYQVWCYLELCVILQKLKPVCLLAYFFACFFARSLAHSHACLPPCLSAGSLACLLACWQGQLGVSH